MYMMRITATKNILRLTVILFSLFLLTSITMAKEKEIGPKSQEFKKRDPALLLSATTLMQHVKEGQKITLVDIRTKEDFEKFYIPGAVNIPLHFIKAKAFLKLSPLVLIHEGYCYSDLEQEVLHLRDKGFLARILDGGLNAWKEKGGRIVGDYFAKVQVHQMPPRVLYKEKDFDNWIIIDVSPSKTAEKILARAVHVPLAFPSDLMRPVKDNSLEKAFRLAVNREIRERKLPYYSVLIVNESGEGYREVKGAVKRAGIENVFYLHGGLKAYRKYVNRLALSWKFREKRVKSVGVCETCGKKND